MKFKRVNADGDPDAAARQAMQQINDKNYAARLLDTSTKPEQIRKVALALQGKKLVLLTA